MGSSTQFVGLCIDGPFGDKRAVSRTSKIFVETRQATTLVQADSFPDNLIPETQTICYCWHEPGLWLLQGVGPEAARIHMAEAIGTEALASRYEQLRARPQDGKRYAK